jgi:antitoxin MazE
MHINAYQDKDLFMSIQILKRGNYLALRIPAAFIKEIQLKDGDRVEATLSSDGALIIRAQKIDRKTLSKMARELRASMKMGTSVMDQIRSGARY